MQARLAHIGKNFVASDQPLGSMVLPTAAAADGRLPDFTLPMVSAGAESHPSTTHAATAAVFAFLSERIADACEKA